MIIENYYNKWQYENPSQHWNVDNNYNDDNMLHVLGGGGAYLPSYGECMPPY